MPGGGGSGLETQQTASGAQKDASVLIQSQRAEDPEIRHDGVSTLLFQVIIPVSTPFNPDVLTFGTWVGGGVTLINEATPVMNEPALAKKAIPTLGLGGNIEYAITDRLGFRLMLQSLVNYPGDLEYIFVDSDPLIQQNAGTHELVGTNRIKVKGNDPIITVRAFFGVSYTIFE